MEDTPLDRLSPLTVKVLSKHLDRGECEEGTWREFAGYSYGATFDNILEIESKPGSPTNVVLDCWLESNSGLNVGHLVKILEKIGRPRAIDELRSLYQDNTLAAPIKKPEVTQACQSSTYQSITSTSSSLFSQSNTSSTSPNLCSSLSSTGVSNCFSTSSIATLFLSLSGAMLHSRQVQQFVASLQNATGYKVELDQQKSSAWGQHTKEKQLYEKFQHAAFVIILIDQEYVNEAQGQSTSEMQTNTKYITELMSEEFKSMGNSNVRFLPYLLDASMDKTTFPPFLYHPPLVPYEHFQGILAEQLVKVQLENQKKVEAMRFYDASSKSFVHQTNTDNESIHSSYEGGALRTNGNYASDRNINIEHRCHQNTAPPSVDSICEESSQKIVITRKNRNCPQVAEHNVNVEQVSDNNCGQVKIKQNSSKKKNKFLNKLWNKQKPRKATETHLIINLKTR